MSVAQQQLDTLARSKTAVERARLYHNRLVDHADAISAEIVGRRQESVFGGREDDLASRRAEHRDVIRRSDLAAEALASVEAEHARHLTDLGVMLGDDGEARASLAHAQAARTEAQAAADAAKAVLKRATAHAGTIEGKLRDAQVAERERDQAAVDRLHAALQSGEAPTSAEAPAKHESSFLEEDLRTARLTVETLKGQHDQRLAGLAAADRAVAAAVDVVLLAEADRVARELDETETRAAMLRRRLVSYTERRPGDYVAPVSRAGTRTQHPGGWILPSPEEMKLLPAPTIRQSDLIRRLAGMPGPERTGPWAENWRQEADAWSAYAAALTDAATAEPAFAIEPAFKPAAKPPVTSATPTSALPQVGAVNLMARDRRPIQQGRFVA